jgi:hypothetical protein
VCIVFQLGLDMNKNTILKSAFTAALLATAVAASPAYALEAKQCLSMTEMNVALKAEGQRTMIIGDREAAPTSTTGKLKDAVFPRWMNGVTSNADGSVGYQIEGDKPRAQTSTQVCVRAKLTNVRVFDARKPGIPAEGILGGAFDVALKKIANDGGARPMVAADSVHRDTNGKEVLGLPIVLIGKLEMKAGSMFTRKADGQAIAMMQMADTEYTAAGLARLNPQVAMNTPN